MTIIRSGLAVISPHRPVFLLVNMQLLYALLAAPLLALAEPVPKLQSLNTESAGLAKRATTCKIATDKVNMRKCPATCCASYGQYAINTNVNVDCWENGEMVNGYE